MLMSALIPTLFLRSYEVCFQANERRDAIASLPHGLRKKACSRACTVIMTGCLSCISVTKEWYQILKSPCIEDLLFFFVKLVCFIPEDLFGYISGILYTTTMEPKNSSRDRCVRSKQTKKPHQKC